MKCNNKELNNFYNVLEKFLNQNILSFIFLYERIQFWIPFLQIFIN